MRDKSSWLNFPRMEFFILTWNNFRSMMKKIFCLDWSRSNWKTPLEPHFPVGRSNQPLDSLYLFSHLSHLITQTCTLRPNSQPDFFACSDLILKKISRRRSVLERLDSCLVRCLVFHQSYPYVCWIYKRRFANFKAFL